jgi:preprotein translocase subunit SecG
MITLILVIHLMICIAMVVVILLQRSEGGALGIGGGGGMMAGRGSGNVLTRATAYLAAAFFATSIMLTVLAELQGTGPTIGDAPATDSRPSGAPLPDLEPIVPPSQPEVPRPQ